MATGWVIYNGHLKGDKFLDYAEWVQAAALKKSVQMKIYKNNDLLVNLTKKGGELLSNDYDELPDFVVFGDKDILLAKQFETLHIPVFNSSAAIEACDHKGIMYQLLSQHQIRIPRTILSPLIFTKVDEVERDSFRKIIHEFGFPMIIKEAYGSFGEQVYLVNDEHEMMAKIMKLQGKPFLFQEFISSSYGRDVRLNVVGSEVVTSMYRYSDHDFRANISSGGFMKPYEPTDQEKELAIKAAQAVGASFAGVDILFGNNNEPIVCEVNGNAHIRNIYECTGINVADYMMDYINRYLKRGV